MKPIFPLLFICLSGLPACNHADQQPKQAAVGVPATAAPAATVAPDTSAALVSALSAAGQAHEDTVKLLSAVIQKVSPRLQVHAFRAGDLNADGRPDLLVVAEQPCPPEAQAGAGVQCRTTFIVLNKGWPKLRIAAANDNVVECSDCGGAGVGDPLTGLVIKGRFFSVETLYGSCGKTKFVATFHYDRTRRDWLLHRFGRVDHFCQGSPAVQQSVQEEEYYGKQRFADFMGGY